MKKLIIAALLLAVSFTSCQNNQNAGEQASTTEVRVLEHAPGQIVYIHMDSLLMNYGMAVDLQSEFAAKYDKAERELTNKQKRFERDFMDYQEKAQKGLATRSQLAEMEEKLQQQDMQLRQDAERLMRELAEEEVVMNNQVFFAISDYLKEFNSDFKYSMIISTNTTGPVINADPSLSITEEVLAGLNASYAKEQAAKK